MADVLPLEMITKIFEELTEDIGIATLWLSCRNVSKSWRSAAEKVFREKHLPKMRITIHLCKNMPLRSRVFDWFKQCLALQHQLMTVTLVQCITTEINDHEITEDWNPLPIKIGYTFSRFADDARDVAIFSDIYKFCDLAPNHKRTIRRALKLSPLDNWRVSPQHVELRKVVNDTEIPGFRYDKRTIEVRCEWKGMVQALISEDRLSCALAQKTVSGFASIYKK